MDSVDTPPLIAGAAAAVLLGFAAYLWHRSGRCPGGRLVWFLYVLSLPLTGWLWRARRNTPCPFPRGPSRPAGAGEDHSPTAALVVANHRSPGDPMLLWSRHADRPEQIRPIAFLMAKELYDVPKLRWFYDALDTIPVARAGRDMAAVKTALNRLKDGGLVGVFPEGGLNHDPHTLRPAVPGAAFLALATDAPVFPVGIRHAPRGKNLYVSLLKPARARTALRRPRRPERPAGQEEDSGRPRRGDRADHAAGRGAVRVRLRRFGGGRIRDHQRRRRRRHRPRPARARTQGPRPRRTDVTCEAAARTFADRFEQPADGAFPTAGLAELRRLGLTAAPLAPARGGSHLGLAAGRWAAMLHVCRHLGRADLSLARLYEGHANGVQLVEAFGSEELKDRFAAAIRGGALSAIWNTERPGHSLSLTPQADGSAVALTGGKVFCSGAQHVTRPVVCGTQAGDPGGWQMCVVPTDDTPHAVDPAGWDPLGVRGTGTYSILFGEDATVPAGNLCGAPGDYLTEPLLTAGAARFLAVQVGACERLLELTRAELELAKRTDHPGQRARAAELTRLVARGRFWLDGLGDRCDAWVEDPAQTDRLVALVRAARTEIEELAHGTIRLASQCLGLRAMVAPHPLERWLRDLTTYLRQPALDTSAEGVGRFALERSRGLFAHELFEEPPPPGDNRHLRGSVLKNPENLPEKPPDWLRQFGRTVVLAPHPDDESLGVGGTIAQLIGLGLPVGVIFLTDGEASHPGSESHPPSALGTLRRSEARGACRALGVTDDAVAFLGLPDGAVPAGRGRRFRRSGRAAPRRDQGRPRRTAAHCPRPLAPRAARGPPGRVRTGGRGDGRAGGGILRPRLAGPPAGRRAAGGGSRRGAGGRLRRPGAKGRGDRRPRLAGRPGGDPRQPGGVRAAGGVAGGVRPAVRGPAAAARRPAGGHRPGRLFRGEVRPLPRPVGLRRQPLRGRQVRRHPRRPAPRTGTGGGWNWGARSAC